MCTLVNHLTIFGQGYIYRKCNLIAKIRNSEAILCVKHVEKANFDFHYFSVNMV